MEFLILIFLPTKQSLANFIIHSSVLKMQRSDITVSFCLFFYCLHKHREGKLPQLKILLTFINLSAISADTILFFFLFIPENRLWNFKQIV